MIVGYIVCFLLWLTYMLVTAKPLEDDDNSK